MVYASESMLGGKDNALFEYTGPKWGWGGQSCCTGHVGQYLETFLVATIGGSLLASNV